ncbi:acyl-CoA-binding domain-containing protein 5A isoform X2 [Stigmatopora argus]
MEVAQSLGTEEQTLLTQQRFDAAVKVIKSLPPNGPFQPSHDMMLKFYSYYKQATVGQCNIARPGFWDAVGKAKWDAWNSLGEMSKEQAMAAYVDEMKLILEGMPVTGEVEDLLQILGPFYELVDEKRKITQISDLSAARLTQYARQLEGFGTSLSSRSVAKSIVRTMERNGTLEAPPTRLPPEEPSDHDDDDDEDDEEEEASPPAQNGKMANGQVHVVNGDHSLVNGHYLDAGKDVTTAAQLASDSDSEVYCDSVDQFGQDESLEQSRSLGDSDEDEEDEEEEESAGNPDGPRGVPHAVRRGGEDGEFHGSAAPRLNVDFPNSNVGAVRISRATGRASGVSKSTPGGEGDGDGGRRGGGGGGGGGAGGPPVDLNEQIVAALAQLRDDMRNVLERLHALEALSATQARSAAKCPVHSSTSANGNNLRPSWWPFDVSPGTLAFAAAWPFVAHWLIGLYVSRRTRRPN